MLKHLRKNPIALLALFLSLGGTAYAANTIVVPVQQPAGATTAYSSIWFVNHKAPELHVEADKSSGITAANVSIGAENAVCLDGLPKSPRSVQVTSQALQVPTVVLAPGSGVCAGKQARIAFHHLGGQPTIYGSFFVTVIS